jgi:hypothetical protein
MIGSGGRWVGSLRSRRTWVWRCVAWLMVEVMLLSPPLQSLAYAAGASKSSARLPSGIHGESKRVRKSIGAAIVAAAEAASRRDDIRSPTREPAAIVPIPILPAALEVDAGVRAGDPWDLFDGDATTGLRSTAGSPVRVRIKFEGEQQLEELALCSSAGRALPRKLRCEPNQSSSSGCPLARVDPSRLAFGDAALHPGARPSRSSPIGSWPVSSRRPSRPCQRVPLRTFLWSAASRSFPWTSLPVRAPSLARSWCTSCPGLDIG